MPVLGVVLDIPQPHSTVLHAWRSRVGDPQAHVVPPHVTLLPPTPVTAADLPEIEAHLRDAATTVEPFALHLSGTGTFRPVSQVVFVQVRSGIAQCELLEKAVRRGPLERGLQYPYHPHVTIAHDVDDAGLDAAYDGMSGFVARFTVSSFALFEQRPAGGWELRRPFALGGG